MVFKNIEQVTLEQLNARNANTMADFIGIETVEIGPDYLVARMPIDYRTVQPLRIVNGGAYCVLAETVGSMAANLAVDRTKYVAIGLDINANHIRSAHEGNGYVYGTAKPIHIGRTTQVWEIKITDQRGKLNCISRLTMAVIEIKNDERGFDPPKI
ncbi:MAG: hotdog fold thioesterase [Bacteroidia bacterium]|jgi:1,4-dihydroxy-2-naphthoyl-CoA hydrolase|nr:hotdog fold thioesterase [Bacteroidia bacterium]